MGDSMGAVKRTHRMARTFQRIHKESVRATQNMCAACLMRPWNVQTYKHLYSECRKSGSVVGTVLPLRTTNRRETERFCYYLGQVLIDGDWKYQEPDDYDYEYDAT